MKHNRRFVYLNDDIQGNSKSTETKIEPGEAEQIEIPDGIANFLQKKSGTIIPLNPPLRNRYWISDIVGCQRKVYYKKMGIEQEDLVGDATSEGWYKTRGDSLHKALTYAYNWHELDIEYYIPLKDGKTAAVVGRLDMYDWKTKKVIDLKTTTSIIWQVKQGFVPRSDDIRQVQCYDTVFSQRLPIEELNLVYVDDKNFRAYKIQRRNLREWLKTKIQHIEDSISDNKVPIGQVSGLCQFCRYQTKCYSDGNGLMDKPLSIPKNTSETAYKEGTAF